MGKETLELTQTNAAGRAADTAGGGVIMPVPVVMQARLELELLAGKSQVHGGAQRIDRLHLDLV